MAAKSRAILGMAALISRPDQPLSWSTQPQMVSSHFSWRAAASPLWVS